MDESKSIESLDDLLALENRGAQLTVAQTDLCPAIVIHARSPAVRLFAELEAWGLEGPTFAAIPSADGMRVISRAAGKGALDGGHQNEAWLLCWFAGGRGWDRLHYGQPCHWRGHHPEKPFPRVDVPWLVVLQRRAERIRIGAHGLDLEFSGEAGTLVAMPLFGVDFLDAKTTLEWRNGPPEAIRHRCRCWASYLRRIPVACRESFRVDKPNDRVAIEQTFDYLAIDDEWQTPAVTIAPYPPYVLLAARSGFLARLEEAQADDEIATLFGPYGFRAGATSSAYELLGLLRYIHREEICSGPPQSTAAQQALDRLRRALADDPRLAVKTSGGFTRGLALALTSCGHTWSHLAYEQKDSVAPVMDELADRLLDPANYLALLRYPTASGDDPVGEAVCQRPRDAYKVVQANLYGLWAYAQVAGDRQTVRRSWSLVKRWFHLPYQTQWLSPLPARWEGLDIARALYDGTIGFARLAAELGETEDYHTACYLFAKVCAGWFAMEMMPRYHREHPPWLVNPDADYLIWHPCRLNGYVAIANDHLLPNEEPLVDGRGWASAYGRMTPSSARFWRDHLRDRAGEALNEILPRCRPDWAAAGAPAVMRAFVLGEDAERLEAYRTTDAWVETQTSRDPLRRRTYRLFQSPPILKELATIEAGAAREIVAVVPETAPMIAPQEGASRTACRFEPATMPVQVAPAGKTGPPYGGFPLLYWPGVRTPEKPFAVYDERLDVLPFGQVQTAPLGPHRSALSPQPSDGEMHHSNWCLTIWTQHERPVDDVQVQRQTDGSFAVSWTTPEPANSIIQYWRHDLDCGTGFPACEGGGMGFPVRRTANENRVETLENSRMVRKHHLVIPPLPGDALYWFRVLSVAQASEPVDPVAQAFQPVDPVAQAFQPVDPVAQAVQPVKTGRLHRSRPAMLPTERVNWALHCTAYVARRFPFKQFKYAADPERWLDDWRRQPPQWQVLRPPHELTDGRRLRGGVEPWVRRAEPDPAYRHWIAVDLGCERPVDEVIIACDPEWVSAGLRIEAGPGDEPWSPALAAVGGDAWANLLAEATDNREAISRHGFPLRRTRWVRILFTRPAPVDRSVNRIVLWEIEVRGPRKNGDRLFISSPGRSETPRSYSAK